MKYLFLALVFWGASLLGNVGEPVKYDGLAQQAVNYIEAMEGYLSSDLGKIEQGQRELLREAFLACKVDYEIIVGKVSSLNPEVLRKINEWQQKKEKGFYSNVSPVIDLDTFFAVARGYDALYRSAQKDEQYKKYWKAFSAFKSDVIELLKSGESPETISEELKSRGIDNERILSRPAYWQAKGLGHWNH